METKSRTIFIGDIHSCLDELQDLIKTLQYNTKYDQLILLGDLTDRGNFPIETIRYARDLVETGAICLMGNHDRKIIRWADNKRAKSNYPSYYDQLSNDDISFIRSLPYYFENKTTIATHAGIKPNIQMSAQSKDDLIYLRYTDNAGRFVSLKQIAKYGKEASGAIFWTQFQPFGFKKDIIYGHHVHSLTDIKIDQCSDGTACYGIDTGCVFGGRLSSIIIDSSTNKKEVAQVQAKETYYKSTFDVR